MKISISIIILVFSCLIYSQDYWQKIQTPVDLKLNTIFCLDSANIWVGADSGKILYTSDRGNTWRINETGRNENIVKLYFLNENHGWGIVHYENFPEYRSIILNTTNGGIDWEYSFYRIENVFLYSIVFFDTLNGWIGGDIELAYTEDGGQNWLIPQNIDSTFIYLPIYELKFFNRQIGYAVGGYIDFVGVVWTTVDSGKSWDSRLVTADPPYDIHVFNENEAYALTSDIEKNYNIEVLKTSNRGIDWTVEILDVFGTVSAISFRNNFEGWAAMGRDKLALNTFDGGKAWDYYPLPDSTAVYDVQFVDSLNGFMVGEGGSFFVYQPQEPSSVIDFSKLTNPDHFHLFQNYPNPFNAQTEIKYALENESFISLKLFNLLGEEINTLDNGWRSRGIHSISIELNDLPSGVYLYQLQISERSITRNITKKMVLLK